MISSQFRPSYRLAHQPFTPIGHNYNSLRCREQYTSCTSHTVHRASVTCVVNAAGDASAAAGGASAANNTTELLLRRLAAEFGVRVHPRLRVGVRTPSRGLGLIWGGDGGSDGGSKRDSGGGPLIAVPASLVLSAAIPGATPGPGRAPPRALAPLPNRWELQIAGLQLWAASGGSGSVASSREAPPPDVAQFWRTYAHKVLPRADELTSLVLWSDAELAELQDAELAGRARAWQAEVAAAHAECFGGSGGSSSSNNGGSSSSNGWPPTLDEWRWAVASVESRAFATKLPGSSASQCQGAVPFLDLANHSRSAPTRHGLLTTTNAGATSSGSAGPSSSGWYELAWAEEALGGGGGAPVAPGAEVFVSYGEKSNAALVEQYGFVLPGNRVDRLDARLLKAAAAAAGPAGQQAITAAAAGVATAAAAAQATTSGGGGDKAAQKQQQQQQQQRVGSAASSLLAALAWRNAGEYKRTTAATTRAAAAAAQAALRAHVESWPTTVEADAAALEGLRAEEEAGAAAGPRQRRAIVALEYRLERKRIANAALEIVDQVLLTSPSSL